MVLSKRTIYYLLLVAAVVGFYLFDEYYKSPEAIQLEKEAEIPKETTNEFYLPTSTTEQIIHHDYYSLSYDEAHEQAEWVAYELKKSHLARHDYDRPYFEVDRAVKTKAAHWRNYKNSGYDRGHLCPAGDRRFSEAAYEETFLTSNIAPQVHEFNSGVWNRLEQKVRYWANRYDGVYVVTGGILKNGLKTIGDDRVSVPQQFYKILLDNSGGNTKIIAFLMPHQDSKKPLYEFVVSVDEIEVLTGIDFFPQLPDEKERRLEKSSSYKGWSFR